MSDLIWEEPPAAHRSHKSPGSRPRFRYAPQAQELRSRPNEWARVAELTSASLAGNAAADARNGVRGFAPRGDFEAVARTVHSDDGTRFYLYARYVGEETRPKPPYFLAKDVEPSDWVVIDGDVMQVEGADTDDCGGVILSMTSGRVVTLDSQDWVKVLPPEPFLSPSMDGGKN